MAKRKLRKPMSEEQKQAAAERLAKARAAKQEKNPSAYKTVHPNVVALKDEHPFSLKNVRRYIKVQREMLATFRKQVRLGDKHAIAQEASIEGYIRHCDEYLRHGVWCDFRYGEYQEKSLPGGVWEAPRTNHK